MISVALCSYDGAKYIEEQLTSILNQTHPVDEIVVCDDGSTDDTLKMVERIAQNSSVPIHVFLNETNVGYFRNFVKAMSLCKGDIIFLCDQDDVWREDKVEKIMNWFDAHKEKDVVFTNARLIDGNGESFTSETLWDRVGFNARMQRYFDKGYGQEILTITNRATGATMALRKTFLEGRDLLSYRIEHHDYTIAYLAASEGHCGFIAEPLIFYRLHSGNAVGVPYYRLCFYSPLRACTEELIDIQNLSGLANKKFSFICKREQWYVAPFRVAASNILQSLPDYIKLYGRWWYRFFAFDMYICLKQGLNRLKNKCCHL